MGGAVSAGEDNEELVDNLVGAHYVKSPRIERVLRCVDRGHYVREKDGNGRKVAYKDLAWKEGRLHVSAPCIYSEVLEALDPQPGHWVLNVGSGTGYLSTLFGLLIGPHGVNQGVELHGEAVAYAEARLAALSALGASSPLLHFDLAAPVFVAGNALHLSPPEEAFGPYDRLYCGAAVDEDEGDRAKNFFLSFLKLGGVAVMPFGDQLQRIKVIGPGKFETKNLMSVSFASLIGPTTEAPPELVTMPGARPTSLQEACRVSVRRAVVGALPPFAFRVLSAVPSTSDCEGEGRSCRRRANKRVRRQLRMTRPLMQVALARRAWQRQAGDLSDSSDSSGDEAPASADPTFDRFVACAMATIPQPEVDAVSASSADSSSSGTEEMVEAAAASDSSESEEDTPPPEPTEPAEEPEPRGAKRALSASEQGSSYMLASSGDEGDAELAAAKKATRESHLAETVEYYARYSDAIRSLPLPPDLHTFLLFQEP